MQVLIFWHWYKRCQSIMEWKLIVRYLPGITLRTIFGSYPFFQLLKWIWVCPLPFRTDSFLHWLLRSSLYTITFTIFYKLTRANKTVLNTKIHQWSTWFCSIFCFAANAVKITRIYVSVTSKHSSFIVNCQILKLNSQIHMKLAAMQLLDCAELHIWRQNCHIVQCTQHSHTNHYLSQYSNWNFDTLQHSKNKNDQ